MQLEINLTESSTTPSPVTTHGGVYFRDKFQARESFEVVHTQLICKPNGIKPLYLVFCFVTARLHLLEEVERGHRDPKCITNNQ